MNLPIPSTFQTRVVAGLTVSLLMSCNWLINNILNDYYYYYFDLNYSHCKLSLWKLSCSIQKHVDICEEEGWIFKGLPCFQCDPFPRTRIGTRKLSLSFRPFEKYSSALFTLLLRTGHATQPGSFTIGTFLLLTAARFDAWRQQAARPRIVNVQNDSTE